MRTMLRELTGARFYSLQVAILGVLLATPAFAAKGAAGESRPVWLTIYKMIPSEAWIFIAVFGIVGVVYLLFFRHMKDCKCKCGIVCKCDCKCPASCPCQIPVLKLKR